MKKNRLVMIIAVSLICAVLAVAAYQLTGTKTIATTISIQFEGIEEGLNPDDTRFDYNEIVSADAIKAVASIANIEYQESFTSLVEVHPILPLNIVDNIKSRRVKGESYTYFPNEFEITIKPDDSIGLDQKTCLLLLDAYKEGYDTYFNDKYKYPFVDISDMISYFDYSKYDYPELTKVFDNEFNMISSYLNVLINDDPDYVSSEGITFSDIQETINISKQLDMNQIDAYVNAYELTNNLDQLILKYEYMIRRYERDKNKAENQYTASESLVTLLEEKKSSVLLPGTNGEMITVTQLDSSYDDIAKDATQFKMNTGSMDEEIKYLQSELDKLYDSVPDTDEVKVAKEQVNALVGKLNQKIVNWTTMIELTAEEYFDDKYDNAITLVDSADINSNRSTKMSLIVALGVLLITFVASSSVIKKS